MKPTTRRSVGERPVTLTTAEAHALCGGLRALLLEAGRVGGSPVGDWLAPVKVIADRLDAAMGAERVTNTAPDPTRAAKIDRLTAMLAELDRQHATLAEQVRSGATRENVNELLVIERQRYALGHDLRRVTGIATYARSYDPGSLVPAHLIRTMKPRPVDTSRWAGLIASLKP